MTIGTSDLEKSIRFYDGLMSILGHQRHSTTETYAGYGEPGVTGKNCLWIMKPYDGEPASGGNGANIAFLAESRATVDTFYHLALKLGAKDDGAPGIRKEMHKKFYATYIIDLDGNKIVAVCHDPEN